MKTIILSLAFLLPLAVWSQNYPTNAQVVKAVMGYNETIATAQVEGTWRLEREEGYNFSNMAKIVVGATTHKQDGISKKFTGLAIYVRGGSQEGWTFSRYFVTNTEFVGLASLTNQQLVTQTYEELAANPINVLPNMQYVAWVYEITVPEGVKATQDLSGDFLYSPAYIEYEEKFIDYEHPFEGGIRRMKLEVTLYVRPVNGQLRVARATRRGGELVEIKKTWLTESAYETWPTLAQKPYTELFGPNGPQITANQQPVAPQTTPKAPATGNAPAQQPTQQPAPENNNKVTLPKVRINIRKNG